MCLWVESADICQVYNHVLRLDLKTLRWELVDNYGDIPGVRMGCPSLPDNTLSLMELVILSRS